MLLSLRDIARFYGHRLVFKNVSLDLRRGRVTLLCGPNGAGKSTLLKIVAGLLKPSDGEVIFPTDESLNIGYLDHRSFIYPTLTALENLRFWADLRGDPSADEDLLPVLERMDLSDFAGEPAGMFSRGMAQRLNLARVFMQRPDLLLLDEPSSGLDQVSLALLRAAIKKAGEEGTCIVWITHSPDQDKDCADEIALLDKGALRVYPTPLAGRETVRASKA
ncbi:MAG: ABC transporter ATP-binding protein [Desulfovibrio sp.]|jgi:heme exporter protein A|nr:ABC transporter ATP-binding protein [Desulfovibrio sp.]